MIYLLPWLQKHAGQFTQQEEAKSRQHGLSHSYHCAHKQPPGDVVLISHTCVHLSVYQAVTAGQPLLPKVTGCWRRWCPCKVRFCPPSMFCISSVDRDMGGTQVPDRWLGDEATAGGGATTPLSAAEPQLSMILCGAVWWEGEVAAHCWPRQGWIGRVKSRATQDHFTLRNAHRTTRDDLLSATHTRKKGNVPFNAG